MKQIIAKETIEKIENVLNSHCLEHLEYEFEENFLNVILDSEDTSKQFFPVKKTKKILVLQRFSDKEEFKFRIYRMCSSSYKFKFVLEEKEVFAEIFKGTGYFKVNDIEFKLDFRHSDFKKITLEEFKKMPQAKLEEILGTKSILAAKRFCEKRKWKKAEYQKLAAIFLGKLLKQVNEIK